MSDAALIIPHYQPLPFPVPVWFIKTFLIVGFLTHLLPMSIVFAGQPLAAFFLLMSKLMGGKACSLSQQGGGCAAYARRTANELVGHLPVILSVAITQGIVPLLFLQLLYGPLYYTSSIIIAWPWLAIVPLLIVMYYGLYWVKAQLQKPESVGVGPILMLVGTSTIAWVIGYLFVMNMTLMVKPELWSKFIGGVHGPVSSGLNWLRDPMIHPRYLHMLLEAVAVSGGLLLIYGLYNAKKDAPYAQWLYQRGGGLIALAVAGVLWVDNALLLNVLPAGFVQQLQGSDPVMHALALVFVGGLGLSALLGVLNVTLRQTPIALVQLLTLLAGVAVFPVLRNGLREFMVRGVIQPEVVPVQLQTDILVAFLILTVGLLVYLAWLIGLVWRRYHHPAPVNEAACP